MLENSPGAEVRVLLAVMKESVPWSGLGRPLSKDSLQIALWVNKTRFRPCEYRTQYHQDDN
jgi:hypothetical protein